MSFRTEQTLRRMWEESLKLQAEAAQHRADSGECFTAAQAHERAAAEATAAAAAETAAAASAEKAARAKHAVAQGMEAEADDLRDLVNRERQDAGLAEYFRKQARQAKDVDEQIELAARADSCTGHWPLVPYAALETTATPDHAGSEAAPAPTQ